MQIATQEVALNDALNDTQILLSLQAKDKGIYLNFVVDENVPSIITTDSLRLRQILINIVGNAVKFTSRGSVDVAVHYQLPESSSVNGGHDQLIFEVKDSGPGLRPDQIEKLFTPFSQADGTSKRRFGGTGLGLVLSKRFANLLGGDVVLTETAPEKGSTFTITINPGATRSSQGKGSTQTKFSETAQFEYSRRPLNGITVLLVDDLPDNQVLIHRLLKLAGAIVEVAGNGQEGIRLANSGQFDIVLMDLQMPIMDGYEATAELRKDGYSGVIVALTAHAMSDVRELCLKSGFNDHISKPVNSEELIARIKSLAPQKQRP
jgi:CheY-like chemotaxis protein